MLLIRLVAIHSNIIRRIMKLFFDDDDEFVDMLDDDDEEEIVDVEQPMD